MTENAVWHEAVELGSSCGKEEKKPLDNPWRLKLFQILRYSMIHPQHRHFILNALKNISTPKMKLMQIASFFCLGKVTCLKRTENRIYNAGSPLKGRQNREARPRPSPANPVDVIHSPRVKRINMCFTISSTPGQRMVIFFRPFFGEGIIIS